MRAAAHFGQELNPGLILDNWNIVCRVRVGFILSGERFSALSLIFYDWVPRSDLNLNSLFWCDYGLNAIPTQNYRKETSKTGRNVFFLHFWDWKFDMFRCFIYNIIRSLQESDNRSLKHVEFSISEMKKYDVNVLTQNNKCFLQQNSFSTPTSSS